MIHAVVNCTGVVERCLNLESLKNKHSGNNAENKILGYHRGVSEGLSVSGIAVPKSNYTNLTVQSTNIYYLA
jgi:hypothetical protein